MLCSVLRVSHDGLPRTVYPRNGGAHRSRNMHALPSNGRRSLNIIAQNAVQQASTDLLTLGRFNRAYNATAQTGEPGSTQNLRLIYKWFQFAVTSRKDTYLFASRNRYRNRCLFRKRIVARSRDASRGSWCRCLRSVLSLFQIRPGRGRHVPGFWYGRRHDRAIASRTQSL